MTFYASQALSTHVERRLCGRGNTGLLWPLVYVEGVASLQESPARIFCKLKGVIVLQQSKS
jgi:hypothetical protein